MDDSLIATVDSELEEALLADEQIEEPAPAQYATIYAVHSDGLQLIFDGETEATDKHYKCSENSEFKKGDRVKLLYDSGTYLVEYVIGEPTSRTHELPSGGSDGQVLTKNGSTNYSVKWSSLSRDIPSGGTNGQYLIKDGSSNYSVKWGDAPHDLPVGGSPNYILAKNTATDFDVKWIAAPASIPTGGSNGQVLTKDGSTAGVVKWADVPHELPTGGTTGYMLVKNSTTNYDVKWVAAPTALPTGGTTGQVLSKKSATSGDTQWVDCQAKTVFNQLSSTSGGNTTYQLQFKTGGTTSNPTFHIRMGTSGTWKQITVS